MKIQTILSNTTQDVIDNGREWYTSASLFAQELGKKYDVPFYKVCGIIAALSPLKEWGLNKRMTETYLKTGTAGHTKNQLLKCSWIMKATGPDQVDAYLYGLKTVNFYHNILDPTDINWVTIDRHIINCLGEFDLITPKRYELLKKLITDSAIENGFIPCELQAILWIYQKRLNKS